MTVTKSEFHENGVRMNPSFRQNYLRAYRYWRKLYMPAHKAIDRAKLDAFQKVSRWPSSAVKGTYNPRWNGYGESHMRWIENPTACGLRFVGFADEINKAIQHTGWYLHDEGWTGETVRGVVYQLPARKGVVQFVAGYDDPNNPDSCCLSFDICQGESGYYSSNPADNPEASTAATWADGIAERMAEQEREYQRVWRAGRDYDELGDEIAETRRETLALIREIKAARDKVQGLALDTVCGTLLETVKANLREISSKRDKRETLFDEYGDADGFADA